MTMTAEQAYPVSFDVAYPERLSRWKPLVKWLLVIPHLIGLYALVIAYSVSFWFSQWAILFTGDYPPSLFRFAAYCWRYVARVYSYALLLRDEYPPFGGDDGDRSPVSYEATRPDRMSRLMAFLTLLTYANVRVILAIPHLLILIFLTIGVSLASLVAFFAILFTTRYPESLFRFVVGASRWSMRVQAYVYSMTNRYPPFSMQ